MTCVLCEPAPHEPCETWGQVHVDTGAHDKGTIIGVCLEHYQVIEDAIREDAEAGGTTDAGE